MTEKLTPAQEQYMHFKRQHKDAILFFRLGDFYEVFYDDAKIAHKVLDITLTARNKNTEAPIPMAGVPHHSLDRYVQKLIQSGYKVAIADQVGEVVPGKVVTREVTRIVTPGTHIGDEVLFSYLVAVTYRGSQATPFHLARGDVSLGTYTTCSYADIQEVMKELARLQAKEVVLDIDFPQRSELEQYVHQFVNSAISIHDCPHDVDHYLQTILRTSTLDGFGDALASGRADATALLFSYIEKVQKHTLTTVHTLTYHAPIGLVHLDHITIKNLEIFSSSYEGSTTYSLYGVINTMKTAMGSRLAYEYLSRPINTIPTLTERLDMITYYSDHASDASSCAAVLSNLPDLPKMRSRIILHTPSAVRLGNLKTILGSLLDKETPIYKELIRIGTPEQTMQNMHTMYDVIHTTLKDPVMSDEAEYILDGYDPHIDELRQIAYHSDELLLAYHQRLVQVTKISNIKLKYVTNQGYLLEVTPKDVRAFEECADRSNPEFDFVRRQTLKGGERYTTPYLDTLQSKIFSAKDELRYIESQLLQQLTEKITTYTEHFLELCQQIARLDVAVSHAHFVQLKGRVRPDLHAGYESTIQKGKHPVVEQFLPVNEAFVPNDIHLTKDAFFHLITGPNMGGKSTFLRQTALITLLAHAGFFVPAQSASIGMVDGIFARVGSGDALAKNQSTFMTEMLEMANILHNATQRSLVILDELGRGTSTYDGLAIAKSIVVYICQKLACKTLFATHYHELIALEGEIPALQNYSLGVYETDHEVVFLKKIVRGGASKSYGIDVAQLAGVPPMVINQAKEFLHELETRHDHLPSRPQQAGLNFGAINDEYKKKHDKIYKLLESLDLNEITPIEALVKLKDIEDIIAP